MMSVRELINVGKEWFFGDAGSMGSGAMNKLQVKAANAADRKPGACKSDTG